MPIIPASSKVILVTGASKGIGLAISRYLLRDNENYVVAIARTVDTLEELRLQHPHNIMPVQDDLADFSIAKKAVDLALEQWGRIEGIVVNHAVATPISTVADCDVEEWRKAFDIIFFSAVALVSFIFRVQRMGRLLPLCGLPIFLTKFNKRSKQFQCPEQISTIATSRSNASCLKGLFFVSVLT